MQSLVVLAGTDTIKVNLKLLDEQGRLCKQELADDLLEELARLQLKAQEQKKPVETALSFYGARLVMLPNGSPTWKYIVKNDCLQVSLVPRLRIPAIGKVTFGKNCTEWVASSAKQIDYWITAGDEPADDRADSISPDHKVRLYKAAIGESEADGVALIDELDQLMPEMQLCATERTSQNALKVCAMNAEKRSVEALLVLQILANRMGSDPVTVAPVAID